MVVYSNTEYADMHLVLGECHGNSEMAVRRYSEKFPNRHIPNRKTFISVDRRLRETGTFKPAAHMRGRRITVRTLRNEENILNCVELNPETSTRRISVQTGNSQSSSWRTLNDMGMYPFHKQKVQELLPRDFEPRVDLCQWYLRKYQENNNFPELILFSDEACFTRNGIFNVHNAHIWADENPHSTHVASFQHQFKTNVWAAIIGHNFIGPWFLPPRLDGQNYLQFLRNNFFELFDNVPVWQRFNMWFMHDGAPPHYSREVRAWLHENFPNKWIGRGADAPVHWPPRSPDLTPLDYSIWGILKEKVYSVPITTPEQLTQRIRDACLELSNSRQMLHNITWKLVRYAEKCIEVDGRHFKHLL